MNSENQMADHQEIIIPNWNDHLSWMRFIEKNRPQYRKNLDSNIWIDFTRLGFIHPFQIVSLSCLIEEYYVLGLQIHFTDCRNRNVCRYLDEIKFFNYWDRDFDRNRFTSLAKQTAFCLWQVDKVMITAYLLAAVRFFENNHFSGYDVFPLHICLVEAFNNIFDHSMSEVKGYTLSQYFPNLNLIRLSVCDFGIGICKSVQNHLGPDYTIADDLAIEKAFELGFSSGTDLNRGFGLDNLKKNVLNTGGNLTVVANSAVMKLLNNRDSKTFLLADAFNGTLIDVELDTRRLVKKELDFIDEELYFGMS